MYDHNHNPETVVVIGGGFGGLATAIALCRSPNRPSIILIEPKDRFVFLPLLYDLLTKEVRTWEVAPSYNSLIEGKGIVLIKEYATKIDAYKKEVFTASGLKIRYSKVVLATGSKSDCLSVPGISKHALMFNTLIDVEILRKVINDIKKSQKSSNSIVIIGGGPSGVELACKVSDLLRRTAEIHLIERQSIILSEGQAFNQEQSVKALDLRGIRVHLLTEVIEVTSKKVLLRSTSNEDPDYFEISHRGLIWTAGKKASFPEIIPQPSFSKGRIRIDCNLNVIGIENMMAIGDVSINEEMPAIPTAQVAMQQGEIAAQNLVFAREGLDLQSFEAKDFGEMLSLGIGKASITGLGVTISGSMAFRIRRLIYLAKTFNLSWSIRSATSWLLEDILKC